MTIVTTAGSMTTPAGSVPTVPAPRFPGSVPTVPVTTMGTVPFRTGSGGRGSVPKGTGTASWAIEVDPGSGWELLRQGTVTIAADTQATLDQLVEELLREAGTLGYRYAVLRASAATLSSSGELVTAYRETTLPLMHRATSRPAAPGRWWPGLAHRR